MELKGPLGSSKDCFEPDPTYPLNFMLDTSAINKLAERPEDLRLFTLAKEQLGYMYFLTLIQNREVIGMNSDGSFKASVYDPEMQSKSPLMLEIIEALPIIRIPNMATFISGAWLLDGTCDLLEDEGKLNEVFNRVFNNNPKHLEDAVIVESAMHYNCTLVSNEKRMCNRTNAFFSGRALRYGDFVEEIKAKLNVPAQGET